MKKYKSLFLVALFGLCSFMVASSVDAAVASNSLFKRNGGDTAPRMIDLVCDPTALEAGDTSECYLIGILNEAADNPLKSVNGFTTQVYTTKSLSLVEAKINEGIGSTKAGVAMEKASTTSSDTPFQSITDGADSIREYRCVRGENLVDKGGNTVTEVDYRCAIFYTKKTSTEDAYNIQTLKYGKASSITSKVYPTSAGKVGLIGLYVVKLDENNKTEDCGDICVKVWEVPDKEKYNTCTSGSSASADCEPTNDKYFCKELKQKTKIEPDCIPTKENNYCKPPETGAFTSYAVLAAGALIAIGAIAMAKKNSRFNKI